MSFAEVISSDILQLLNQQRTKQNIASLNRNPTLEKAAFLKAQDMLDNDYFAHKSPAGITGWYWIQKAGYAYETAGENLAIGFLNSEEVHQGWNNSPMHKDNLLNTRFQDVGIAVLTGDFQGNKTTVVVQFFAKPQLSIASKIIPPVEAKTKELVEEEIAEPVEILLNNQTNEGPGKIIDEELVFQEKQNPYQSVFWEFVIEKYNNILQKAIFLTVVLIILILIFNVIIILTSSIVSLRKVFLKESILPSVLALLLLIVFSFLDKSIIIQFIPHHFLIR